MKLSQRNFEDFWFLKNTPQNESLDPNCGNKNARNCESFDVSAARQISLFPFNGSKRKTKTKPKNTFGKFI